MKPWWYNLYESASALETIRGVNDRGRRLLKFLRRRHAIWQDRLHVERGEERARAEGRYRYY